MIQRVPHNFSAEDIGRWIAEGPADFTAAVLRAAFTPYSDNPDSRREWAALCAGVAMELSEADKDRMAERMAMLIGAMVINTDEHE